MHLNLASTDFRDKLNSLTFIPRGILSPNIAILLDCVLLFLLFVSFRPSLYSRCTGITLFLKKSCCFSGCWFMTTEDLVNGFVFDQVDLLFISLISF